MVGQGPAAAVGGGVEPALVLPAGDVRRMEQPLPGHVGEPRPRRRVDAAPQAAEQSRGVDGRRLDHARAEVEGRVAQDRLHHGPDLVLGADVELLERPPRRGVGWHRDEVAPQLLDEEPGVHGVAQAERAGVLPVERAALPEDHLVTAVVPGAVEAEVRRAHPAAPLVPPAGQRPRLLAHVALGVAVPLAEREQLHQLAGVVLVGRPLRVVGAGEPDQHRRVGRDLAQQHAERAERPAAQQPVLPQHQRLRADAVVRRGEPVVPDQGHALDERPVRPHHAVEPPELVVTPGVGRCESRGPCRRAAGGRSAARRAVA